MVSLPTELIVWTSVASGVMFVASLVATPYLIVRMPADYFVREEPPPRAHPVLRLLKNLAGLVLLVMGALMLFLPGQGLLTILIGLIVMDFPGKRRLERRLVAQPRVHQALAWLRRKYGKKPLKL
jgi:hypothetical protein